MTNTTASTLNAIDTIATVGERTARITGTILWLAAFTAVAITGACYNATYDAREAYAAQVVEQVEFIDELQAERLMLPAAAVTPVATFQEFVTQTLQPELVLDLAETMVPVPAPVATLTIAEPEVSENAEALLTAMQNTDTAIDALKATVDTITLPDGEPVILSWSYDELMEFSAKALKAMAKEVNIAGYGRMRKAQLAEALAA